MKSTQETADTCESSAPKALSDHLAAPPPQPFVPTAEEIELRRAHEPGNIMAVREATKKKSEIRYHGGRYHRVEYLIDGTEVWYWIPNNEQRDERRYLCC